MRRCTVYWTQHWKPGDQVRFEGWLLSVDPEGTYQHCSVVDEDGRVHAPYTNQVRVHVPTRVDLMDGAPRRAADTRADGPPYD